MDLKRTKLAVLVTTIIATGCSANKLDTVNSSQNFCKNGGASSDFSCQPSEQQSDPIRQATVDNPNTEAWMNSKLSDIKSWLKTIKENPDALGTNSTPDVSQSAMLVRNPAATNPELIRIEALSQNNNHREAMAAINSFIANNPNSLEAELTKGLVLSRMGQLKEAEALLRNSISRHPTSPELYNNLAVIYSDNGDYGKAIETLLLAFSTHPSYAQVNENLREVYSSVASLAYNRALDLDSDKKLTPQLVVLRRTSAPSLPALSNSSLSTAVASSGTTKALTNKNLPETALSNTVDLTATATANKTEQAKQTVAAIEQKPEIISKATKNIPLALPDLEPEEPPVEIAKLAIKPQQSNSTEIKSIVRTDNNNTKAGKAPGSSSLIAVKAVNSWSQAWSSQNVSAYLASYITGYQPKSNVSHKQWRNTRTQRLTKPSFIKIQLANIKSKQIDSNTVEVTFLQKYQANTYKDQTNKRLTLVRSGSKWLISKERNI
jgi:tetratricopeptide (TPR) repeat protein